MTEIDLKLLKSSDDLLNLLITSKQKESMEVGMKKVASTGAVLAGAAAKTSRVIQFAIAYYLLLSSGEALAQLFEGKGAGLEVHASFGPIGSAFTCMGSMAVALGKKLIARMKRKSMCLKECTLEPQEEGILGLEAAVCFGRCSV